jgi:hypothetical protein
MTFNCFPNRETRKEFPMPQQIIRLYDTAAQGAKAAQDLTNAGFEEVFYFKASGAKGVAASKLQDALVADMAAAHIYRSHAVVYASQLAKGGGLVLVHAPFGAGVTAARILGAQNPSSKGIHEIPSKPEATWDEATPLSSALHLPVLAKVEHPFETLTGFSSLTKGSGFLSSFFGIPLLSRGLQHAQSSFGIPLLSRGLEHAETSMGLPLLSRSPTPLSSMLGLKVLSR